MKFTIIAVMSAWLFVGLSRALAAGLGLEQAVDQALIFDEWLESSRLQESALRDEAISNHALPDPVLSLSVANLPADSWEFDQENMTQMKIALAQRFPGGDSRSVMARKYRLQADVNPYRRLERRAQLTRTVSNLWLDSYLAKQSIQLIEAERYLFQQLIDVTVARYQSAFAQARQQDVIRAQLELTKLDDRLTRLRMQYDINRQLLSEWLPHPSRDRLLAEAMPDIAVTNYSLETLDSAIKRHPLLAITDKQIDIQQADIDLAQQQYHPGWTLNASYGYREDAPSGEERSDFLSLGVSFDLPLFVKNRQDKNVSAANSRKQALAIDYRLLQKKLLASALKTAAELQRLEERSRLYQERLLPQTRQQTESSLSAYTNDDGDFADVMRANIVELNSKIEALEIDIQQRKVMANMRYLLAGVEGNLTGEPL